MKRTYKGEKRKEKRVETKTKAGFPKGEKHVNPYK